MTWAKAVAGLGAMAMVAILIYGFAGGDFFAEGGQLVRMPWGIVSLVDLYVGFLLFALWILYREGFNVVATAWIAAVMVLGSLAICLYCLVALSRSGGSWKRFFHGRHADAIS